MQNITQLPSDVVHFAVLLAQRLLKLVTDSLSLSAGCNPFHNDVALKDLWPLAVWKSGMFSILELLVFLSVEMADLFLS